MSQSQSRYVERDPTRGVYATPYMETTTCLGVRQRANDEFTTSERCRELRETFTASDISSVIAPEKSKNRCKRAKTTATIRKCQIAAVRRSYASIRCFYWGFRSRGKDFLPPSQA
jgi:hypothetical protein